MRIHRSNSCKSYEYGDCTILVRCCSQGILDGLIRGSFTAQIHPVGGGDVITLDLQAFYPWDAANQAHDIYARRRGQL